jgi:hypothetical protein
MTATTTSLVRAVAKAFIEAKSTLATGSNVKYATEQATPLKAPGNACRVKAPDGLLLGHAASNLSVR